jgi:hypothetical protein
MRPLRAYILLKKLERQLAAAIEAIQERAIEEFYARGEKEATIEGCIVKRTSGRTTYDYSPIPEHGELKKQIAELEEQARIAFKLMAEKGRQHVNADTGEIIQPCHAKTSKDSITVMVVPASSK